MYFALSVNPAGAEPSQGQTQPQTGELSLGQAFQTPLPAHTNTPKLWLITEVQILGLVDYKN